MKKSTIQLEELVCPMCSSKIENALKRKKGVESINVSYNSAKAKVVYDESLINIDQISKVITDLGYEIITIKYLQKRNTPIFTSSYSNLNHLKSKSQPGRKTKLTLVGPVTFWISKVRSS